MDPKSSGTSASPPRKRSGQAPRGTIRQAQRELTRARLIDAAIEVFAERGYAKATVDDIAERAGVTRATFYLHFSSRSALMVPLVERSAAHFHGMYFDLSVLARTPTVEATRRWISAAIGEWPAIADVARALFEASAIEPAIREQAFSRGALGSSSLADELQGAGVSPDAATAAIHATILLAPLEHYFRVFLRGGHFDAEHLADVLARAWVTALAS